ncbi:hypothetical protein [Pseudomonas sp. 24 R 17]|nr:hypothetical protein [Pseudomonas sp. 24 R 17]
MTIFQAGGRRVGGVRQCAALVGLTQYQFAKVEYAVSDGILGVVRTFQGHGQTAARRADATGPGDEATIQVQTVVGREADAAAIAGHLHPALARNIQARLGAGSIQAGAVAYDHKQVAGLGNAGGQVDVATDADLAAITHLAVDIATAAHRRDRTRSNIDQRVLAHPDRAAMASGVSLF